MFPWNFVLFIFLTTINVFLNGDGYSGNAYVWKIEIWIVHHALLRLLATLATLRFYTQTWFQTFRDRTRWGSWCSDYHYKKKVAFGHSANYWGKTRQWKTITVSKKWCYKHKLHVDFCISHYSCCYMVLIYELKPKALQEIS